MAWRVHGASVPSPLSTLYQPAKSCLMKTKHTAIHPRDSENDKGFMRAGSGTSAKDQIAKQNNAQTCALRTALPRKGCTDIEMVALPHRMFDLTSEVTENINDSVKYFQKPFGRNRNALWSAGSV